MKKSSFVYTSLYLFLFAAFVLFFDSCKKKEDPAPSNQSLLSSGTWKIKTVTVDGVDQTSLFTGFTLLFNTNTYASVNGIPVWPNTGSYTIDNAGTSIQRDDAVAVSVTSVSQTALVLSLEWTKATFRSGRESSIKGKHVFSFTK
jgi:hypothetical protein